MAAKTRTDWPAPGSDSARAGVHEGFGVGCECHPGDNNVVHPTGDEPVQPHHGQAAVSRYSNWVINPECPMHGPGGPAASMYAPKDSAELLAAPTKVPDEAVGDVR